MLYLVIYYGVIFLLLGTVLGSFFNVVIYRMPRELSVAHPPSACPNCDHKIKWYENIPILSYIFLGGKCSACKNKISIRYPLVEALSGIFSLALYFLYFKGWLFTEGFSIADFVPFLLQYISLMLFIPISFIDIEHYIIPNEFTIGGLILGMLASFLPGGVTPQMALLGVVLGAGILLLFGKVGQLILKRDDTMGLGDVKMLAWFGALFGPEVALGSIFIGAFAGLFGSLIQMALKRLKKGEHLPFGPYLCIGAFAMLIWGKPIINLYLKITGLDELIE